MWEGRMGENLTEPQKNNYKDERRARKRFERVIKCECQYR